jgi:adenylate cyclase
MASEQLAVLFADVCDSTTIYEALGDERALGLVNRLFEVLAEKVNAHSGKVVKTLGDAMICQFPDADTAFHAACDLQSTAIGAEPTDSAKLAIKIAFNWGPVVTEQGDVFGDTVNVCARLVGLGNPHQVVTTQQTVEALSAELRESCRELFPVQVRGRIEPVHMCEVVWREDPDRTEMFASSGLRRPRAGARQAILKLTYAGDTFVIEPAGSIKLGRDKENDVVVNSGLSSRMHARIYGRGGNFVIADQSSNGTFLLVDGAKSEVRLRREEAVMGERGYIGLGGPASSHGDHVLRYRLESREPA